MEYKGKMGEKGRMEGGRGENEKLKFMFFLYFMIMFVAWKKNLQKEDLHVYNIHENLEK